MREDPEINFDETLQPAVPKTASNDMGKQPTTVEGINTPWILKKCPGVSINLTAQEGTPATGSEHHKETEQSILPQSLIDQVTEKPKRYKIIFPVFVLFLILIAGGYKFYVLILNRQNEPIPTKLLQRTQEPIVRKPANAPPAAANTSITSTASTSFSGTPDILAPSSTSPAIAAQKPLLQQLKINQTPTGYLNVRNQPSLTGKVIGKVNPGGNYPFTQLKNGWYMIRLPDKQQGWVNAEFISVQ